MIPALQHLRHARVPVDYSSRYGLLGRFGVEVAGAFLRAGMTVNAERIADGERALAVFFNVLSTDVHTLLSRGLPPSARPMPLVNWLVDSPLAFDTRQWDLASQTPGYRLATTSDEEIQLLKLRWPTIRHGCVPHGVDPEALCDRDHITPTHAGAGTTPRDIDVLVTGSIATPAELLERRQAVPLRIEKNVHDLVALRLEHPSLTFTSAYDLSMPTGLAAAEHWNLLNAVFRTSTMMVNARRRIALVRALQGLNVVVLGAGEWGPHCTGTVRHAGNVPFDQISAWIKRAKVTIALNPPQFTHAISERLLLSLAGGAATITDDRLQVRRLFCAGTRGTQSTLLRTFDVTEPSQARAHAEQLLADHDARAQMGTLARDEIAGKHHWQHRLIGIVALAVDAIQQTTPAKDITDVIVDAKPADQAGVA